MGIQLDFQQRFKLWLEPLYRPPARLIWLILLLGFALRLAWLLFARPVPVSDFEGYRQLAINLLDRHFFGFSTPKAYRLPGNPAFLALAMLVSRSVIWLSFANVLLPRC